LLILKNTFLMASSGTAKLGLADIQGPSYGYYLLQAGPNPPKLPNATQELGRFSLHNVFILIQLHKLPRVLGVLKISERGVCRVLGQHRSTQRRLPQGRADEGRLLADMIELTRQYGRYGYSFAGRRLQSNLPRGVGVLPC
jgi:hypothetical protein